MFEFIKHGFISFLIGLILCPPSMVLAADITPDAAAPASKQAAMDVAPNGVPVVNIAAPNSGGLSHNMFTDFNVGAEGVILNNSIAPGVSQLGGTLAPNNQLGGRAASTILNEVTGTGRSSIKGYTEIFGQSAKYILANPNGISINGGGFINTPKATLTTGTPQFNGRTFQGVDVRGGDILIEGAGINTNNINTFEIVTRAAQINANVYASRLRVITGQNRHNPVTDTTTPLTPDGSVVPAVSIDSSALGGMYAGRISLVGTEAGVGVNTQGIVQATHHLEMTADGKIQIRNSASSAQTLALTSTNGEVAIAGKVRATDTATLSGKTVTVAKVDIADTPIVNADKVVVNAGTLNNEELIAGDSEVIIAATNVNNSGTIYSGSTATFRISDTLHNDHGAILAKGHMVFEGVASGLKMGTLQNDSGSIESLNEGLTFRVDVLQNNNAEFQLNAGAIYQGYIEGAWWDYGDDWDNVIDLFEHYMGKIPHGASRKWNGRWNDNGKMARNGAWLYPYEADILGVDIAQNFYTQNEITQAIARVDKALIDNPNLLTNLDQNRLNSLRSKASQKSYFCYRPGYMQGFVYTSTKRQDTASGADAGALIAAQSDIIMDTGTFRNNVSTVNSATGNIVIDAVSFDNYGQDLYIRDTVRWGRAKLNNQSGPSYEPRGSGTRIVLTPTDTVYSTIEAGQKVSFTGGIAENGVVEHDGVLAPRDQAAQDQKVADVTTLTDTLPRNGLFQVNTNPAQNYQVETNPNLTNLDTFFGSEYQLARMGFDPNDVANKRLGDAFYETRLVRDQIQKLTGGRYLEEGVNTDADQFVKLMDNALLAQTDLGLNMGVSLSLEQIEALDRDIVWLEQREINGEAVLVPVVYLGSNSLGKIAQGGSVIAGREVEINTTENTSNAGLIQAREQVVITAENFLNNTGTVSAKNVTVAATDSILNSGGTIKGNVVSLKATNDVVIGAATTTDRSTDTVTTTLAKKGEIEATNSLVIEAGKDIRIQGSDVSSDGDTLLKAGDNVVIATLQTTSNSRIKDDVSNSYTDIEGNVKSTVKVGGDFSIESGENTAIHGSDIQADGNVAIRAGGNVTVAVAENKSEYFSHSNHNPGGLFGGSKSFTNHTKSKSVVESSIKSGGSMNVEAGTSGVGDIAVVGSQVESGIDMQLKAEDGILISSAQDEYYNFNDESNSSFFKSQKTTGMTATTNQVGSSIVAGNDLTAEAKNVAVTASKVHADNNVSITSTESDVLVTGAQDTTAKFHEEKKSSINSLNAGILALASTEGITRAKWHSIESTFDIEYAKFQKLKSAETSAGNVGAQITAGNNVEVDSARDAVVIGSAIAAGNDVTINAARDTNIIPGQNAQSAKTGKETTRLGSKAFSFSETEISSFTGLTKKEETSEFSGEYNAKSLVSAGNDVVINSGNNINQVSSDVEAGRDVQLNAGNDINVSAGKDVEHMEQYIRETQFGTTLAARQSVTTAANTLADMPKNMQRGEGSAANKGITAASAILRGVSALQQLSSPGGTISLTEGLSVSESSSNINSSDALTSSIMAGRDASLDAKQDVKIKGAQIAAGENVTINAGGDAEITSATNNYSSGSDSRSASVGGGVAASYNAGGGASFGIHARADAAGSNNDAGAVTHSNAAVTAGDTLTVNTGKDATLAGANLEGRGVVMDVGGDLIVKSEQDKRAAAGSNWNVGGSVTIGYGYSGEVHGGIGESDADSAWVTKQTTIIGKEKVDIRTEDNTHVEGAVIAAENGNLKLDTDTLTYKDILDHDSTDQFQLNLSASTGWGGNNKEKPNKTNPDGSPFSETIDGSYSSSDREQINRATIGEGEIIIRSDPDAGLEGLNRDLAKAQEITKDEKSSVTVYIDSAAIKEVLSGFKGIKSNLKNMGELLEKLTDLLPDELKEAGEDYKQTREDLKELNLTDEQISELYKKGHGDNAALYSTIRQEIDANGGVITQDNAEAILAGILAQEDKLYLGLSASLDDIGKAPEVNFYVGALLSNTAGTIEGMLDLGYDAYDIVWYVTDMVHGSIYQVTGAAIYKANYDRFNNKQMELVQAGYFIVNNYEDIPADVVDAYNDTMKEYWALKAQGKHVEAGRLVGPACKDIALAAVGGVWGVKKGSQFFKEVTAKNADNVAGGATLFKDVWKETPIDRGNMIEGYLASTEYKDWFNVGQLNNGKYPLVDFQKGNNLVSLKTVDTTGNTWLQRMKKHIVDLSSRGATVDGIKANMMLDLRVQPGGSGPARSLIKFAKPLDVTVVIKEMQ